MCNCERAKMFSVKFFGWTFSTDIERAEPDFVANREFHSFVHSIIVFGLVILSEFDGFDESFMKSL